MVMDTVGGVTVAGTAKLNFAIRSQAGTQVPAFLVLLLGVRDLRQVFPCPQVLLESLFVVVPHVRHARDLHIVFQVGDFDSPREHVAG